MPQLDSDMIAKFGKADDTVVPQGHRYLGGLLESAKSAAHSICRGRSSDKRRTGFPLCYANGSFQEQKPQNEYFL